MIVYAPDYRESLWKVNANGGTPERVTKLDLSKHSTHRWPVFLPDGKHFLFYATNHAGGRREDNGIYMGSLDSDATHLVLATDGAAMYSSGYLLYHQQNALVAQKFDVDRGAVSGDPIVIANDVQHDSGIFHTVASVSDSGVLVYEPGSEGGLGDTDAFWMDRTGKILNRVAERAGFRGGRLSPDGKRFAVALGNPKSDIWVLDMERGSRTRLTFDDGTHLMPSWSGDGQRVAYMVQFGSTLLGGTSLHARLASGGGQDELLLAPTADRGVPVSMLWPEWSPDGRYLMYIQQSGPSGASLWVVPTSPGGQAQLIVKPETPTGKVTTAQISPDGKWLAYGADDGGREEVYVTSFPGGHGRWQVTREGGTFPVWRKDGKEIYYIGYDVNLYAVSVNARANEVEVGNLQNLFNLRNVFALGAPYDVAPDGKKFLVLTQPPASAQPMTLVLNWTADLK